MHPECVSVGAGDNDSLSLIFSSAAAQVKERGAGVNPVPAPDEHLCDG